MGSLRRLAVIVAGGAMLTVASTVPAQLLPDPNARKAADKCQRGIKKAAIRLVSQDLKLLDACTARIAACIQTKAGEQGCLDRAGARCVRDLDKIAREGAKLEGKIAKQCGRSTAEDLLRDIGVGWVFVAPACLDDVGVEVVDVATAADCLRRQHVCAIERMFALQRPRAGELLRLVGLDLGLDTCLEDYGGDGESVGDRALGKTLEKCARAVTKASRTLTVKKLMNLEQCVDAVFTCLQRKPGDQGCLSSARETCDKAFACIDTEAARFDFRIDRSCRQVSFNVVRDASGARVDALLDECLAVGIDGLGALNDHQNCVERHHQCLVDESLPFEVPRAEELLMRIGRGLPTTPFCPLAAAPVGASP